MRFMMMVIPEGYESAAPDAVPRAEAVAKMTEYNKSLQKAGVLLAPDRLFPHSTGAHISYIDKADGGDVRAMETVALDTNFASRLPNWFGKNLSGPRVAY